MKNSACQKKKNLICKFPKIAQPELKEYNPGGKTYKSLSKGKQRVMVFFISNHIIELFLFPKSTVH